MKFFILILLLVTSNITTRSHYLKNVQNVLEYPIYISKDVDQKKIELIANDNYQKLTITFWVQLFKIQNQTFDQGNIFQIQNTSNNQKIDPLYPICPYTSEQLQQYPQLSQYLKQNKNCSILLNASKQNLKIFEINIGYENHLPYVIFNYKESEENENLISSEKINFPYGIWTYFQVSMNSQENKIQLLWSTDDKEQKVDFSLKFKKFEFSKNLMVFLSQNTFLKNNVFLGKLYDINIYQDFIKSSLPKIFNYSSKSTDEQNIITDLNFSDAKEQKIKSQNNEKVYNYEGISKNIEQGLEITSDFSLQLGSIFQGQIEQTLVQSPSFMITQQLPEEIESLIMLEGKNTKNQYKIKIQKKEGKYQYLIIQNDKVIYEGKLFTFEKLLTTIFSIVNQQGKIQFYFFYENEQENSQTFEDQEIWQTVWTFYPKQEKINNLILHRLVVLQNSLPYIFHQENILGDKCEIFLIPNQSQKNICLSCNSLVLDSDYKCQEICEQNQKNDNGVCVQCYDNDCGEVTKPIFDVQNIGRLKYALILSESFQNANLEDLKDDIKIYLKDLKPQKDYNIEKKILDKNTIEITIIQENSIINTTMTIYVPKQKLELLSTKNREKVEKLEITVELYGLQLLSYRDLIFVKIMSFIIVGIFWLSILYGIVLFYYQFKYTFDDYSFKRLYYVFQRIQIIGLLVFCAVLFPIYRYTIGLLGFVWFYFNEEKLIDNKNLINLEKTKISELFIENLSFIIILQNFILLFYLVVLLLSIINKIKPFSAKFREKIFNIRDSFEYSFLINLYALMAPIIFAFLTINLKYSSVENISYKFSLIVSFIYLALFGLFFIVYFIVYISQRGLKYYSSLKMKINFLFVGYTESSLSNIYEIVQLILTMLICIILGGLFTNVGAQTNFLLFLQLLQLIALSFIKPHIQKWDKIQDAIDKVFWTIIFLLISCLQIFDIEKNNGIRSIISWITIILIFIQIFFDFIGNFFASIKFLINLKQEDKLSFYGRYTFEKIGKQRENNLVEMSEQNSFMQERDSIRSINKINSFQENKKPKQQLDNIPFKELKDQDQTQMDRSSFFQEKFSRRTIKEEIDEFQSGSGSLHESYISKSAESGDREKKNGKNQNQFNSKYQFKIQLQKFFISQCLVQTQKILINQKKVKIQEIFNLYKSLM